MASVDKAMEMGINWWQDNTFLSLKAKENELKEQNKELIDRLEKLEVTMK